MMLLYFSTIWLCRLSQQKNKQSMKIIIMFVVQFWIEKSTLIAHECFRDVSAE